MREVRRCVTNGVTVDGDLVAFPELALHAHRGSAEAASLGLVGEETSIGLGRFAVRIPPWFTSRAMVLPAGVIRGALVAVAHYVRGMSLAFVAATAAVTVGICVEQLAVIGLASMVLLLLASVVVHETGHVVAHRLCFGARASAIAVVRGIDCRLIRARGKQGQDLLVAVAGPLAPSAVAAAAWAAWGLAPFPVLMFTLVALGHVLGLVLPVGDGAAVRDIASRWTSRPSASAPKESHR